MVMYCQEILFFFNYVAQQWGRLKYSSIEKEIRPILGTPEQNDQMRNTKQP
jgi:hypothetical protein